MGIDVHKKSYSVAVMCEGVVVKREATVKFFRYAAKYRAELNSLLTENFELIGA